MKFLSYFKGINSSLFYPQLQFFPVYEVNSTTSMYKFETGFGYDIPDCDVLQTIPIPDSLVYNLQNAACQGNFDCRLLLHDTSRNVILESYSALMVLILLASCFLTII